LYHIIYQVEPPYSPCFSTLMDNPILISFGLFYNNLCDEDLYSACYILNRIPYKNLDRMPYEFWNNKKYSLKYFKVWKYPAKVNILITKKKIDPKTINYTFVGYSFNSTIYRFLFSNSKIFEITNNIIIESCM